MCSVEDSQQDMAARWQVVGASVPGTAHLARGLPCQDAHLSRLTSAALILAVADGAGSAPYAAEGAAAAVGQAVRTLAESVTPDPERAPDAWRELMAAGFAAAGRAIEQLAAITGHNARAFATTLACCICTDTALVAGQVGDGLIVAQAAGRLWLAATPQRGEYANEAFFVTQTDALARLTVTVWRQPVDGIALSTDGLLRLALRLPAHEPHPAFFEPLFAFAHRSSEPIELARFLASPRVCARTDDDKTLLLAVRQAGAGEPEHPAPSPAETPC
jgi:hypothetical protein